VVAAEVGVAGEPAEVLRDQELVQEAGVGALDQPVGRDDDRREEQQPSGRSHRRSCA
jgi:hypothetical protein